MTPERPISELASLIQTHTSALEAGMKGQAGAEFSLAASAPLTSSLPPELEDSKAELLETLDELRARVLGPFGYMTALALPVPTLTAVLGALYEFDIAAHVPTAPGASITYAELGRACGLPADDARRVLQAAAAFRVFAEAAPDAAVRHNGASALLARVPGTRALLGLLAAEQAPGAARFAESLRRFPGSGEPGHAALALAIRDPGDGEGEGDPTRGLFALIADDAERVARFRAAMGLGARAPGFAASYFVEALPWGGGGGGGGAGEASGGGGGGGCPARVVDVGGAGGELCAQILRRYAGVRAAVVLDLPEVVAGARAPGDLAGRLAFAPHDFLAPADAGRHAADAFVFRHVFHDWSDAYAVRILRNLLPALRRGNRVWLNEVVLPDLSERHHLRNQRQRGADLLMKLGFNGKERSRRGWEAVFAEADPRFRIENIKQPKGAHDAVIQVVFDG
ncbi:S-adenosyl-L-methionine-dependent methyltransferase [Xylariomycetidae sp. FL0641]|nr:S-adenosyl-L-methionine-dependent methyltransferase [Xylariomycetidae sp. FL0641]